MADDESAPPQSWPIPAGPPARSIPPPAPAPTADWARPGVPGGQPPWAASWAPPSGPRHVPPGAPAPRSTPPPSRDRTAALVVGGLVLLLVVVLAVGLVVWRAWGDGAATVARPGPGPGSSAPADPSPRDADPTPSPTGAPPTASREVRAYVDSANEYCRTTTDPRLKEVIPLYRTDPERFFRESAKITRDLDGFLRRGVPPGIADDVEEMTDRWDGLATSSQQAADALASGDPLAAAQHIEEASAANAAGNAVARRIGLPDCADAGGLGGADQGTPGPTSTV